MPAFVADAPSADTPRSPQQLPSPPLATRIPTAPNSTARILCFGDSLTMGRNPGGNHPYAPALQARLALRGASTVVVAIGHSGWPASLMVRDADSTSVPSPWGGPGINVALEGRGLPPGVPPGPFDAAVILAGTNDVCNGAEPAATFADIVRLHKLAWRAGAMRTVAVGVPESTSVCLTPERRALVNARLEAWAPTAGVATGAAVRYIPCPAGLADLSSDGVHFSGAGYDHLGSGLADLVGDLLVGRPLPAANERATG